MKFLRLNTLLVSLFFCFAVLFGIVSVASAHTAVGSHTAAHAVVAVVEKKKKHHPKFYITPTKIALDTNGNAHATLVFREAAPKGVYQITADVFPLCTTSFLENGSGGIGGNIPVVGQVTVDRFGDATVGAVGLDCSPGTTFISARLTTTPFTALYAAEKLTDA